MRIAAYVDGFNLYYGLFRGPGCMPAACKWLDIVKLVEMTVASRRIAGATVVAVRYCSSPSLPSKRDPSQPLRQEQLWNALRANPIVKIIEGLHVERPATVCAYGEDGKPQDRPFKASKREEKGSDVNLAAYLIRDAAKNEFDIALVFTDDSDLENAVRIAKTDFGKQVWVVSPYFRRHHPVLSLDSASTRYFKVNTSFLPMCQLPDPVIGTKGEVLANKPKEWV